MVPCSSAVETGCSAGPAALLGSDGRPASGLNRTSFEKDLSRMNAEIEAMECELEQVGEQLREHTGVGSVSAQLQGLSTKADEFRDKERKQEQEAQARRIERRMLGRVLLLHGLQTEQEIEARMAEVEKQRKRSVRMSLPEEKRLLSELVELGYAKNLLAQPSLAVPAGCDWPADATGDPLAQPPQTLGCESVEMREHQDLLREQYKQVMSEGWARLDEVARLRARHHELTTQIVDRIAERNVRYSDFEHEELRHLSKLRQGFGQHPSLQEVC